MTQLYIEEKLQSAPYREGRNQHSTYSSGYRSRLVGISLLTSPFLCGKTAGISTTRLNNLNKTTNRHITLPHLVHVRNPVRRVSCICMYIGTCQPPHPSMGYGGP